MNPEHNGENVLADYVSREELAEQIDRCSRTLDRWASLGIGPPRTILGRRILYRRQAVAEWLRAQEEKIPSCAATIVLLVVTYGYIFVRAVA